MNINKKNCIILALGTLPMLNSCSDSWLEPKPLSFYSPETHMWMQKDFMPL